MTLLYTEGWLQRGTWACGRSSSRRAGWAGQTGRGCRSPGRQRTGCLWCCGGLELDRQRLETLCISPAKLLVLREVWINEDSRTGRSRHLSSKESMQWTGYINGNILPVSIFRCTTPTWSGEVAGTRLWPGLRMRGRVPQLRSEILLHRSPGEAGVALVCSGPGWWLPPPPGAPRSSWSSSFLDNVELVAAEDNSIVFIPCVAPLLENQANFPHWKFTNWLTSVWS